MWEGTLLWEEALHYWILFPSERCIHNPHPTLSSMYASSVLISSTKYYTVTMLLSTSIIYYTIVYIYNIFYYIILSSKSTAKSTYPRVDLKSGSQSCLRLVGVGSDHLRDVHGSYTLRFRDKSGQCLWAFHQHRLSRGTYLYLPTVSNEVCGCEWVTLGNYVCMHVCVCVCVCVCLRRCYVYITLQI
jgi:hypothetical protein